MTGKYKSQYAWTNCSIVIRTQVNILLDALREVLGESLVGIYLHGSFQRHSQKRYLSSWKAD